MKTSLLTSITFALTALTVAACDTEATPEPDGETPRSVEFIDFEPAAEGSGGALSLAVINDGDYAAAMPAIAYAVEIDGAIAGGGITPLEGAVEPLSTREVSVKVDHLAIPTDGASVDVDVTDLSADTEHFRGIWSCSDWVEMCESRAEARCIDGVKSLEFGCDPNYCRFTCHTPAY